MTLNEYQEKAMKTCLPSSENFSYMMLNLVGEVGEFASKVAKAIRKGRAQIGVGDISYVENLTDNQANALYGVSDIGVENYVDGRLEEELKKEAGDIMWQLSGLCHIMDWTLEDVCKKNLEKLSSRKERGVIDGNGDNR